MLFFWLAKNKTMINEHCPNCKMVLEDPEVCNFCEWTSNEKREG